MNLVLLNFISQNKRDNESLLEHVANASSIHCNWILMISYILKAHHANRSKEMFRFSIIVILPITPTVIYKTKIRHCSLSLIILNRRRLAWVLFQRVSFCITRKISCHETLFIVCHISARIHSYAYLRKYLVLNIHLKWKPVTIDRLQNDVNTWCMSFIH